MSGFETTSGSRARFPIAVSMKEFMMDSCMNGLDFLEAGSAALGRTGFKPRRPPRAAGSRIGRFGPKWRDWRGRQRSSARTRVATRSLTLLREVAFPLELAALSFVVVEGCSDGSYFIGRK